MNLARMLGPRPRWPLLLVIFAVMGPAQRAHAQGARDTLVRPLITVRGVDAARRRILELDGRADTEGHLLRSALSLTPPLPNGGGFRWEWVAPEVRGTYNSEIPLSLNDGSIWAGRGSTVQVMAGFRARRGPFVLVFAPQWARVENRRFSFPRASKTGWSAFLPPWRAGGSQAADLPERFGRSSYTQFDFGQSFLGLRGSNVTAGITTEDEWWGPGVRNALVLGNNGPGIPRIVIRTTTPRPTRLGEVGARWASGVLTESLFFDSTAANDRRAFNAAALTLRPRWEPSLTLGVARAVVAPLPGRDDLLRRGIEIVSGFSGRQRIDLQSFFARWLLPLDGVEVYGEWMHQSPPPAADDSLAGREGFLNYTLGLAWARPLDRDSTWSLHLAAEVTDLENRASWSPGAGATYSYISPAVPQGYTQRGQSIGAAIGPGSSSQWIGLDLLAPRGLVGIGVERVRWSTDAFYTQPTGWSFIAHDVSVTPSAHATFRLGANWISVEVAREKRLNYLFQNWATTFAGRNRIDVSNLSVRVGARVAGW